jgi:hypothetical protein
MAIPHSDHIARRHLERDILLNIVEQPQAGGLGVEWP